MEEGRRVVRWRDGRMDDLKEGGMEEWREGRKDEGWARWRKGGQEGKRNGEKEA